MDCDRTTVDAFRLMEKRIKNYGRDVAANLSKQSKRQRLKASAGRTEHENNFHWSEVFDVQSSRPALTEKDTLCSISSSSTGAVSNMCDIAGYTAYDLTHISPGLFVVSRALSVEQQIYWATKAVEEYSTVEHNNLNNLQSLYGADSTVTNNDSTSEGQQHSEHKSKSAADIPNVEDLWVTSRQESVPFETFARLRWSCLGYHYDWTKRMYQKNLKSTFPADLALLCNNIARIASQELTVEAAIINYYPLGAIMGGHLDDAEHTMEKPIISISLGLSAIFLIGGRTRQTPPTPILVRSGDAVIMSGESRYCFHGIPLILPPDFQPLTDNIQPESLNNLAQLRDFQAHSGCENTKYVVDHLHQARVNMNVRQVRKNGCDDEWIDKSGTGAASASVGTNSSVAQKDPAFPRSRPSPRFTSHLCELRPELLGSVYIPIVRFLPAKMGYTTEFVGSFDVDRKIDRDTVELINKFSNSRRMKRDPQKLADALGISLQECLERYLEEGQLYCDDEDETSIVDHNSPPSQQPGLWCQWIVADEGRSISWDGNEKFYNYGEWLEYLIAVLLKPRGYTLNGCVRYIGEDYTDMGYIEVKDNVVVQYRATGFAAVVKDNKKRKL